MRSLAVLAILCLLTSGCTTIKRAEQRMHYLEGPNLSLNLENINAFVKQQDDILRRFATSAGICPSEGLCELKPEDPKWKAIAEAGMNYIDLECEKYIDSIFWFDRHRKTASNQITALGAATAAAMGMYGVASTDISMTALAFGLTNTLLNNVGSGLLYQLEPSAVREVVKRSQSAYRESFESFNCETKTAAVRAIRGYLELCLPATIEAAANRAVADAMFETKQQSSARESSARESRARESRDLERSALERSALERSALERSALDRSVLGIVQISPESPKINPK